METDTVKGSSGEVSNMRAEWGCSVQVGRGSEKLAEFRSWRGAKTFEAGE